jgi:hypothetical protein
MRTLPYSSQKETTEFGSTPLGRGARMPDWHWVCGKTGIMALTDIFSTGWRHVLYAFQSDYCQQLIEVLRDQYIDAARDVAQFEEHARRMTYPPFRDRLLRIAGEEKAHVYWLRDKLQALSGEIPQPPGSIKKGKNGWECLQIDLEEEKRDRTAILNQKA